MYTMNQLSSDIDFFVIIKTNSSHFREKVSSFLSYKYFEEWQLISHLTATNLPPNTHTSTAEGQTDQNTEQVQVFSQDQTQIPAQDLSQATQIQQRPSQYLYPTTTNFPHIRRPPNCFMLFRQARVSRVRAQNPGAAMTTVCEFYCALLSHGLLLTGIH